MAQSGRSPLTARQVGDLMFYVIAGVLVGGRLGHVIFYGGGRPLIEIDSTFPYWEVLKIHKGGMASHGGMAGVILACWLFARRHKLSAIHLFDLGAIAAPAGLFLGRLANFVNAELWGKALPEHLQKDPPWWSVKYPDEIRTWPAERLVELRASAEAVADALPAEMQEVMSRFSWEQWLARMPVDGEARGLVHATLDQIVAAFQHGNEIVVGQLGSMREWFVAYYPSQIFQAISDGPVLVAALALAWWKPRKPGVVGCWFLVSYGVLRIATEVFRQPDEGVALLLGLSRGQWLSVLMAAAGAALLPWVVRRAAPKYGGLVGKARRHEGTKARRDG
jgi:phosphatidylglycerol---prolipoprotein diacylglyceryl transferase